LKVCVKSAESDKAVEAIVEAARTGEVGDGKIFVYPVTRTIRIRTGETDENAL
jgi:nitrogen regulatory protein PII